MNASKSLLEILIDKLPGDFIKAQPMIKEEIAPLLIELDEAKLEHYLGDHQEEDQDQPKSS